jgi:hypothetical protein
MEKNPTPFLGTIPCFAVKNSAQEGRESSSGYFSHGDAVG